MKPWPPIYPDDRLTPRELAGAFLGGIVAAIAAWCFLVLFFTLPA